MKFKDLKVGDWFKCLEAFSDDSKKIVYLKASQEKCVILYDPAHIIPSTQYEVIAKPDTECCLCLNIKFDFPELIDHYRIDKKQDILKSSIPKGLKNNSIIKINHNYYLYNLNALFFLFNENNENIPTNYMRIIGKDEQLIYIDSSTIKELKINEVDTIG